jgi:hypothetical protein
MNISKSDFSLSGRKLIQGVQDQISDFTSRFSLFFSSGFQVHGAIIAL